MAAYIAAEGLDFGMASLAHYRDALEQAGFVGIETISRNGWYRGVARAELDRIQGPWQAIAEAQVGADFVDHNSNIWTHMLVVLDSGEHCPTHIRAQKPDP